MIMLRLSAILLLISLAISGGVQVLGLEEGANDRNTPVSSSFPGRMDWAANAGASHIVTVAADTPFFPSDLVERLLASGSDLAMAVTPDPERGQARHPTFGLWPVAARAELRAALHDGVRKVVQWTQPRGCVNVEFPASPFDPFFNVNTPEDLAKAEAMIAEFDL